MFDHPTYPEVTEWFATLGVDEVSYSVCAIDLTNEPIEYWFYKRNQLRPESLKLNLCVPANGNWCVDLSRHDKLFNVQWRPNDDLRVESQQLRYRKLIKWPHLYRLMDFPLLVAQLEQCLDVRFVRHADVNTRLLEPEALVRNPNIRQWLAPCADTLGWDRRMQSE
ncbi:hypothetical protein AQS70_13845 [Pseudomonas endophytica]|uniref:Uncharacterized protein n=1 Tax=Pseudomonas endophytica TaxID=1563157 RepID=A0A0N8VS80_9PSED|nr:hypothetical protein [Pseudomonas endophytica]KQB52580.1 hypothetical protein AQS70_13845 [Pseudomonas endophytica]